MAKTRNIKMYVVALMATLFTYGVDMSDAVEEAAPERLLLPRNFNPHPYQARGPVLFPTAEPSPDPDPTRTPIVTVGASPNPVTLQDLDGGHPYAKVVRKQKLRLQILEDDNQINPQVYGALARHAHKVLHKSLGQQQIPTQVANPVLLQDPTFSNQKKDYQFSYIVQDRHTGDDFSHSQSQDSRATSGEYRVKLPDGRLQIVSYSADKDGYKADVKYDTGNNEIVGETGQAVTGPAVHQHHQYQPQIQRQQPQQQIRYQQPSRIAVVSSTPVPHLRHNILHPQNLQVAEGDYVEYNAPYYVPFVHDNAPRHHHHQLTAQGGKLETQDDISVYQNQVSGPTAPQHQQQDSPQHHQHFILSDKFQLYSTASASAAGQEEEDDGSQQQKLQILPQFTNIGVHQNVPHTNQQQHNGYTGAESASDLQRYSQVYFRTPNQHVHHQQNHGYY